MKEKILVVEDNPNIQLMLKAILEANDYEAVVAKNGKAGSLALYNDEEIVAVICDIMMPESDGFDFLDKTAGVRKENNIPVCMLTALEDSKNVIRSLEAGANDYMIKPIDKDILLEKISTLLNKGDQQSFSTCKAEFPVKLSNTDEPVVVRALNEIGIVVEIGTNAIDVEAVFQFSGSKLNELTGISEFIVKTTKITELGGTKAAKLEFIGLMENHRKKIRSVTIKGEEILEHEKTEETGEA